MNKIGYLLYYKKIKGIAIEVFGLKVSFMHALSTKGG